MQVLGGNLRGRGHGICVLCGSCTNGSSDAEHVVAVVLGWPQDFTVIHRTGICFVLDRHSSGLKISVLIARPRRMVIAFYGVSHSNQHPVFSVDAVARCYCRNRENESFLRRRKDAAPCLAGESGPLPDAEQNHLRDSRHA